MKKPAHSQPTVYDRVQFILASAQDYSARSVNTAQVVANWLIGREIVEEQQHGAKRAGYGEKVVDDLTASLRKKGIKGYGKVTLKFCRQFFLTYPDLSPPQIGSAVRSQFETAGGSTPILSAVRKDFGSKSGASPIGYALRSQLAPSQTLALVPQVIEAARTTAWKPGHLHPGLSWTHYRALMRISKPDARAFYEIEAAQNHWKARELERQIASLLFERLARSRDKKGVMALATKDQEIQQPADVFKDPVVIEFLGLPESHRLVESTLEEALLSNLQSFLLELGKGFAFVARQERLTLEGDHFYVDLVFYHTVLKCYVLIDLKVQKLTHQDLGQLQLYVNYYDRERRTPGDQPTLGLILCTDKNDTAVKYTLGTGQQNIFASRYQLHLPSEADLAAEIRRELALLAPAEPPSAKRRKTTAPKRRKP